MTANDQPGTEPEILEMPSRKMAAVYARGVPEEVFPRVLPDLYASLYTLNMELEKEGRSTFSISGWRARYPDAHLVPVTEWTNVIGVPVPETTTSLPQKVGGHEIKIEIWEYGTVAQVMHSGQREQAAEKVESLLRYINDNGYRIAGVHEEEYPAMQDGKAPAVITRYRILKKQAE